MCHRYQQECYCDQCNYVRVTNKHSVIKSWREIDLQKLLCAVVKNENDKVSQHYSCWSWPERHRSLSDARSRCIVSERGKVRRRIVETKVTFPTTSRYWLRHLNHQEEVGDEQCQQLHPGNNKHNKLLQSYQLTTGADRRNLRPEESLLDRPSYCRCN